MPNRQPNPAFTETVTAFDPQLPMTGFAGEDLGIPAGVTFTEDNKAVLSFRAPTANSVAVRLGHSEGPLHEMEKQANGVWTVTLAADRNNYTAIFFEVDGVYALNPMAPIGWSHAHPINILDFPNKEDDFYSLQDVPHGTVTRDYYFSKTCNCFKSCLVYAPPGYMRGKYENLPVLYLQHGYGENETSWVHLGKVNWIMDNLLAAGQATPCLIVMNNGMVQIPNADGSRTWDPQLIEGLLLDDCLPHIESHYRVATDKWQRAMAGLSMGSMQASVVTLSHPEVFGYAGIFSGFIKKLAGITKQPNSHLAILDDKPRLFESYKLFFRCIGDEDTYIRTYNNESALLKKKGLSPSEWPAHQEIIYPGGHDWNVWRPCVRDFLMRVFK
uniref:Endo-1,4-beta-xylanase A n=1 Tax=uncultured bacterium contig00017 TaxID=1181508 RepID=A0A806JXZ2_9BACT|nr:endo-1,4-beta-xylanase A precursor [uncultured bacterium contig00017]